MQYDDSPEPTDLSGFADESLTVMLGTAKGLESAALRSVLSLRRERTRLIREVDRLTKEVLRLR